MRAPGGYPAYPMPRRAVEERLRVLSSRVFRLEDRLLRAARPPSPDDLGELRGWEEERVAIADALDVIDRLIPSLPRCGCGKRAHALLSTAERHAATLRLVDDSGARRTDGLNVYLCPHRRPPAAPAYHVGHGREYFANQLDKVAAAG